MARLFCAISVSLVFCVVAPGLVVYYLNLDYYDELKWESRLAAVNRMIEKADEIQKQTEEMEQHWGDLLKVPPPAPEAIREAELKLKKKALETITLSRQLQGVLLRGALYGSERSVKGILDFSLILIACFSLLCVLVLFVLTLKWGINFWATRMVARTLLRGTGVKVQDIPAKDLLQVLEVLGACKWHLSRVKRLMRSAKIPASARSVVDLLQQTSALLNGLLDRSDIPTIAPDTFGLRELSRKRAQFEEWKAWEQRQLHDRAQKLEEQVALRVHDELEKQGARLEADRRQFLAEQTALQNQRRALEQSASALTKQWDEISLRQQRADRDRSYSQYQQEEVYLALDHIRQWGRRIDAAVLFLQAKLQKLDPEGSHPSRPALVLGLAQAMDVVAPHREADPAYVI